MEPSLAFPILRPLSPSLQHPHPFLISRHALLPTQPLVEIVQEEADALVVVRVQFQRL
jgi:hypothetical protein